METKYRTINDGFFDYLQYEDEIISWFGRKKKVWKYVWKPYYDTFSGRNNTFNTQVYINSLDRDLIKFCKDYPDVQDYFKIASAKQKELEEKAKTYREKVNRNRGKIVEL